MFIPTYDLAKLKACCSVKQITTTDEILRDAFAFWPGKLLPRPMAAPLKAFLNAGRYRWQPHAQSVARLGSLKSYDLVVARYLQAATTFDLFGEKPLVLDVDDYDPHRLRQRIAHSNFTKNLTLRRALRHSKAAHHQALPLADHCWVANPADRQHHGLAEATVLPNIPYKLPVIEELRAPSSRPSAYFLFVGTLNYSANSDGVDAFLRESWPVIISRHPTAEFHIVGQGMSAQQKVHWGRFRGVKPIGFVEKLDEAYGQCLATVAPILAGGGTNIKVLESGAYARACVVTAVAHRGFETTLPAGKACLRAETMKDMVEPCLRLLREPGLAERIGMEARRCVETHYTPEIFAAAVREGCARALASSGRKLPSFA